MSDTDFWRRLQEDWQSASPAVDLGALRRQVHRKRRRMQVLQVLDVLLGLVATGFMVRMVLTVHKPHTQILFWGLLVIVWVAIAVGAWLRYTTWNPRSTDAASLLQLTIRRARAGFHFIWLNVGGLIVVYAVAVPFFWHLYRDGTPAQRGTVLGNLAFNAGFFAITVGWAVWYGRRQHRKIRRAQGLLRQLEQENGDVR
jgi:hypothetical protein